MRRLGLAVTLLLAACSSGPGAGGSSASSGSGATASSGATSGAAGTSGAAAASGTGGAGSSSAGSGSGGSTGGPGLIDADCGADHLACHPGQHCAAFGGGSTLHYGCACTPATSNAPDSCAANPDGRVLCERYTLDCRAPRDYDLCDTASCESGYRCVRIHSAPYADGGFLHRCERPCVESAECTDAVTHCVAGAIISTLSDGGTLERGACLRNYCGPDLVGPDGGPVDAGFYFGPCDAADAGDGVCEPRLGTNGPYGYCYRAGPAGLAQPCGVNTEVGPLCQGGALCLYSGDPAAPASCYSSCDFQASPGEPGSACPNRAGVPTTCRAFESGVATSPDPGFCK